MLSTRGEHGLAFHYYNSTICLFKLKWYTTFNSTLQYDTYRNTDYIDYVCTQLLMQTRQQYCRHHMCDLS